MAQFTAGSNHGPINIDLFGHGKWRVSSFPIKGRGPWGGQLCTDTQMKLVAGMIPFVRFYGIGKHGFYLHTVTHSIGGEAKPLSYGDRDQFMESGLNEFLFDPIQPTFMHHVIDWSLEHKFSFSAFTPVCFGFYWVADSLGLEKI